MQPPNGEGCWRPNCREVDMVGGIRGYLHLNFGCRVSERAGV